MAELHTEGASKPDQGDPDAWVLLAETRTVKVLGKRLAGRDTQANKPNADEDCRPSQTIREGIGAAADAVVVAGQRKR